MPEKNSAGSTLNTYAYGYDKAGNLASKTVNGTGTTVGYNAANEPCCAYAGSTSAACSSPPTGPATYACDGNGDHLRERAEPIHVPGRHL